MWFIIQTILTDFPNIIQEEIFKILNQEIIDADCKCISETPTPNESYRDIIKYMLAYIDDEKKKRHNQFVNIFDTYHIDILTKYNI